MTDTLPLLGSWAAIRTEAVRLGWDTIHLNWLAQQRGAVAVQTWTVFAMPGSVQAAGYARAVQEELGSDTPQSVADRVRLRLSIGALLASLPQEHYITAEALDRRPNGSTAALREQLGHLAGLAAASKWATSVRVVPLGAVEAMPLTARTHNFRRITHVWGHPYTVAESQTGFVNVGQVERTMTQVLAAARDAALPADQSIEWLAKQAEALAD